MKKLLTLLSLFILFTGCATMSNSTNDAEKKEETVFQYGFSPLCPVEASQTKAGVNYANVNHSSYFSKTTGLDRGYNYILPEYYDPSKKYPVLYFLHGIFGDENSIPCDRNNKIAEIYKNLCDAGVAEEMIIVFPNMFAVTDRNQKPGFTAEAVLPYDNFINDLVNDLIPHIEGKFSTYTDRQHRAIMGFSMGGRETLFIGLSRSDLFGYFGAVAPAPGVVPGKDYNMTHEGQFKSEAEMTYVNPEYKSKIMICCGTNDSVVGKFPSTYHRILTANGIEHEWYEVPGADHNSVAISSGFYNFIQKIFK